LDLALRLLLDLSIFLHLLLLHQRSRKRSPRPVFVARHWRARKPSQGALAALAAILSTPLLRPRLHDFCLSPPAASAVERSVAPIPFKP
jgi:hypothetical protein